MLKVDLFCVKSAVKPQPTNQPSVENLFSELQQSCVYPIMSTEGVPQRRIPWNCQGNVREFHCVWRVVTLRGVCVIRSCRFNAVFCED